MKILFALFFVVSAHAIPYKMAGNLYDFSDKEGLLVYGCEKSCDALKTIHTHRKIDLRKVRQNLKTANSAGSDICTYVYKEKALIGLSPNQDRRAFCLFPDKSMVELNSLEGYLRKKHDIKE